MYIGAYLSNYPKTVNMKNLPNHAQPLARAGFCCQWALPPPLLITTLTLNNIKKVIDRPPVPA